MERGRWQCTCSMIASSGIAISFTGFQACNETMLLQLGGRCDGSVELQSASYYCMLEALTMAKK
eukprot:scaffold365589_cov18-Prasinocladus_malaysianus.AAC.1